MTSIARVPSSTNRVEEGDSLRITLWPVKWDPNRSFKQFLQPTLIRHFTMGQICVHNPSFVANTGERSLANRGVPRSLGAHMQGESRRSEAPDGVVYAKMKDAALGLSRATKRLCRYLN